LRREVWIAQDLPAVEPCANEIGETYLDHREATIPPDYVGMVRTPTSKPDWFLAIRV
jgi:hypothetical protein